MRQHAAVTNFKGGPTMLNKLYRFLLTGSVFIAFGASSTLAAPKLENKADRSYISITGNVASTTSSKGSGFTLDYGDGLIAVEVDDYLSGDKSAGIIPGERVTVNGRVDNDLFETRSIEADSVYVHNRNTYYYASSADEELNRYSSYLYAPTYPVDGTWLTVSGVVKSVSPADRSFEIDTGVRELEIETQRLGYNPLDQIGFQKIQVGDRVSVTGLLDSDFFDEDDIIATSIVTLSNNGKRKS